jgi:hypothetical protein
VALYRVQAATILQQVIAEAREASSKLGVLPCFWLHDLLCATSDGFRF